MKGIISLVVLGVAVILSACGKDGSSPSPCPTFPELNGLSGKTYSITNWKPIKTSTATGSLAATGLGDSFTLTFTSNTAFTISSLSGKANATFNMTNGSRNSGSGQCYIQAAYADVNANATPSGLVRLTYSTPTLGVIAFAETGTGQAQGITQGEARGQFKE